MAFAMDAPPVQYVTTSDGYSIAYAVSGEGQPLVLLPANLYDTQQTWRFFPDWLEGLASRFRVIQYDHRGGGMSTRGVGEEVTLADYGRDLEAVVDRLRLERFVLAAFGGRCHVAVRYAAAHIDRVEALVLSACTLNGSAWMPVFFGMLPSENWNLFLRTNAPSGLTEDEIRNRVEEFHRTVTLDDWNAWMHALSPSDIAKDVSSLRMPTLVLHPRDFVPLRAEESMKLAAAAPNGRFVLVDGEYGYGNAAQSLAAIDSFFADLPDANARQPDTTAALSPREVEVLRLLASGKSNQKIADELVISRNTVLRHVNHIFDKAGVTNRVEATAYAHRNHIV
jgi:DNA-binding CsgD family transcriptional regulator/pimeloyl-ACP methyl ester carboxylesterase